jgi:hypothetical protein
MRISMIRKFGLFVLIAIVLGGLAAVPAFAQFQNPINAARDAYNKAKQQQQQPPSQQGQQPNPQTQPASTTAGPVGTPAQRSAAGDQGVAAPWTPSSGPAGATGVAAAQVGPLDPAKLPDVAGIHVGTPIDEIPGLLKKLHPNVTFQPQIGYIRGSGIAVPDKQQAGVWAQAPLTPALVDSIYVDYTWAPNKLVAFMIKRDVSYPQPVAHQNLVNALRQKYGKEIQADGASPANTGQTDIDGNIVGMWWLFDEQGHPVPRGQAIDNNPYGCIYAQEGGQGYNRMVMDYLNKDLPPANFCDSVILLYVKFNTNLTNVFNTATWLVDKGLMRRAATATGDWARAGAQKQHQQEQQKANQAKPTL